MDFAVAEFTKTKEVEVVPNRWILRKVMAYWPPFKGQRLTKAIKSAEKMDPDSWEIFDIRIIKQFGKL